MMAENTSAANDLPAVAFVLEPRDVTTISGEPFEIWVPSFDAEHRRGGRQRGGQFGYQNEERRGRQAKGATTNQESLELARRLLAYLRSEGAPVPLGQVYDYFGDQDLLGEYGPQKDGKVRWKDGYKMRRAIARVAKLDGPDAGWAANEFKNEGRWYVQAIVVTSHTNEKPANPAKPENDVTEDPPL